MNTLAKIRSQIAEIEEKIATFNAEISDLRTAERVVAKIESAPEKMDGRANSTNLSQLDMIVATLRVAKNPWMDNWTVLQEAISGLHGATIPKSSLQPYLSNLKNKDVIVRDGPRIALRERVAKGAGPQSDESYDPETAHPENDDGDPPSRARVRLSPPPWVRTTTQST